MNYQIKFRSYGEFKRAAKKLQEITNLPLSSYTKQQLYGGLFKNKHYCIAISGLDEILTIGEAYIYDTTTIKLPKIIKYNKHLLK